MSVCHHRHKSQCILHDAIFTVGNFHVQMWEGFGKQQHMAAQAKTKAAPASEEACWAMVRQIFLTSWIAFGLHPPKLYCI